MKNIIKRKKKRYKTMGG